MEQSFQKNNLGYRSTLSRYEFNRIFGTSEASFISYNFNQTAPRQSVGKLFPNVEAKLFEKDSKHIGLLKVRSEMTFSGYVGEEQISNEWIETGDYALIRNRNLYLVGRKSDRLIIGGVNVYPSEIEQRDEY